MAPCGCFFDPRIYHIEWIANEFPHPSVYKLLEVPRIQNVLNTNLPGNHRYAKDSAQSTQYAHYQQTLKNTQHGHSLYNKDETINITEQGNDTGPLGEATQVKVQNRQKEGLTQQKKVTLPQLAVTIPGLNRDGNGHPTCGYNCLTERFSPENQLHLSRFSKGHQESQGYNGYLDKETGPLDTGQVDNLIVNPEVMNISNGTEKDAPNRATVLRESMHPSDPQKGQIGLQEEATEAPTSRGLPEEVLLEDAMKMFDCIPGNTDFDPLAGEQCRERAQYKNSKHRLQLEDFDMTIRASSSPCKESLSDISLLNLPDELLSPDYSVPEISDAVGSMDYFYNIKELSNDLQWEDLDSEIVEEPSNHFVKQSLPFVKKMAVSRVNSATQSSGGTNLTTSPGGYHLGMQDCLEEMEDY
ncbi:proline-rich protein 22 isoform X2 [Ambystoma mexicanum]